MGQLSSIISRLRKYLRNNAKMCHVKMSSCVAVLGAEAKATRPLASSVRQQGQQQMTPEHLMLGRMMT